MGEDQDLYFRMSEKTPIVYCRLPLTAYRMAVQSSLCATYDASELHPAYIRLEQRALQKQMPESLRPAAIRLVSEARITQIRSALMAGERSLAFRRLAKAWRGAVSRRWWLVWPCVLLQRPMLSSFGKRRRKTAH